MRKFSLLLCVFIMLSLLGCSQEAPLPAPEATTPQLSVTATESATEAETETVAELPVETAPIEEVIPETTEGIASRFTVCPLWPLGKSPIFNSRSLEPVDGLEPPTC